MFFLITDFSQSQFSRCVIHSLYPLPLLFVERKLTCVHEYVTRHAGDTAQAFQRCFLFNLFALLQLRHSPLLAVDQPTLHALGRD